MRLWSIWLLPFVLCLGCNFDEGAGKALVDSLNRVDYDVTIPEDIANDVSGIVDGGNQFALDLYQQMRSEEGNLFFSPASVSTALTMAYAGAAGETEAEMARALYFEMPSKRLHEGMQALQRSWVTADKKKGIRLSLANRLWGQEKVEFLPEFLRITRDQYDAELAQVDFSQPDDARRAINSWVKKRTEKKIPDLIPPGVLSSSTKLVLTNAVYFDGIWARQFKKSQTKDQEFHLTATHKIEVPMMYQKAEFLYGKVDNLQVLELPYADGSLSMVVLLPDEVDGLASLEDKLTFENLERWTTSVKKRDDVQVSLPKFKTTSQFDMKNTLLAMGMQLAFDPIAGDFSRMTAQQNLYIWAVVHKAFVDVDEQGTRAAASTGVVMNRFLSYSSPIEFRADRPFVFMIRDNRTHSILFLGRITNPLK